MKLARVIMGALLGVVWMARSEEMASHWAFRPLVRPPVPTLSGRGRNPVDAFIEVRLAAQGLSAAPEADRDTLIRRIFFDLVGLPPAPEDVRQFAGDRSPMAFDRLADQLLASPRFGERWGRHWLDGVRFAETHGFEMNNPRPNAWPYRDYVIHAFNGDLPYDRFVREQLAGDVLGVDEATGFLVAGPWDQVKSPDEVLTKNQRADELHDMVSTTGSAFLGLTIGCARCHDHKFDPIPQTDYYALKAVFEGVQHGDRERHLVDTAAREREAADVKRRLAEIEVKLEQFETIAQVGSVDANRLRAPVHSRRNVERFAPTPAKRLRFVIEATTGAEPCLDEVEVFAAGTNVALAALGTRARSSGTYPNSELHRLEHLNDGRYGNDRSWISNEPGKGWIELEFPQIETIDRVVWGRDREEKFGDRLVTEYRIEVEDNAGRRMVVASSLDRRPFKAGQPYQPEFAALNETSPVFQDLSGLLEEQTRLTARARELAKRPAVYAGEFKAPGPTRRFHRGDPMQPREEVAPGGPTRLVNYGKVLSLPDTAPEPERRLALADWIVDPANPLTARVIVNRLWQAHFGEGIVSTPSDFGLHGERPSHPELLDWLACELIENGWSLKHIHRLIVTSATYRQVSGRGSAELETRKSQTGPGNRENEKPDSPPTSDFPLPTSIDSANRLLWHYPSRRLEAEPIRDAMLAVAGRLDLRMGGPGWSPFELNENYVRVYTPKQEFEPDDFRRMVYATVVRQRPEGVFGVFDCPDGGQIAPKRTRSTTPLQALNLLNSHFVMQVATLFAERLERECSSGTEARVRRAFALAWQREPAEDELVAAVRFVEAGSLPLFCRALLNSNEFVYVF